MKRISIIMAFVISGTMAFAQIGVGNSNPQAVLDIRARDSIAPTNEDGILIPRVSTFPAINPTANQQSMLVFLTTTVGFNTPGFYYWDNPTQNWVGIVSGSNSSSTSTLNFDGFEDFLYHEMWDPGGYEVNLDNQLAFGPVRTTSNGGALGYIENTGTGGSDYLGHYVLTTGTTSSARVALCSFYHVNKLRLGDQELSFEARVRIPNGSTLATSTFKAYFGLTDLATVITSPDAITYQGTVPGGEPTNGVYFWFEDGMNSGHWMATTKRSASTTYLNTGVTLVVNQWYSLRAIVNVGSTIVDFYIDDVLVATSDIANTIPGPLNPMKWVFKIEKTSGNLSKTLEIDYIGWRMVR